MSKETKIEWADSTVNFWSGCTKVSDGCKNCYAESLSNRKLGNIGGWGNGADRKRHQSAFNLAFQLNKKPWICNTCGAAMAEQSDDCINSINGTPGGCAGEVQHRRRVFSLSLGDWLDPEVRIEWLAEMLDVIRRCDQLEWLLVTKRPELWKQRLTEVMKWHENKPCAGKYDQLWHWILCWVCGEKVPQNIMVLTSVENQKAADERIPALLKIPAAKRGLSCEPLLGSVDLRRRVTIGGNSQELISQIDWAIIGGESGTGARPCNVDWIRDIKDQCEAACVPVFVKQLGANPVYTAAGISPRGDNAVLKAHWNDPSLNIPWNSLHNGAPKVHDKKGGDMAEWPADLRVREFPKDRI
jgi:protein gp37